MKKIINGKVYNTETAVELGHYSTGGSWSDLNHLEETLYRKRTGEFFLYGEGGPRTRYARQIESNTWASGESIMPLTYDAAQAWAEKRMSVEVYEDVFGAVTEDESRSQIHLSLANSTIEAAKQAASQQGLSLSAYIESLILVANQ